jgi:hypothetical protein
LTDGDPATANTIFKRQQSLAIALRESEAGRAAQEGAKRPFGVGSGSSVIFLQVY